MNKSQFSSFLTFIQLVCTELWAKSVGKFATIAEVKRLKERMADFEDGQEPLALTVDFETGMLVQSGTSSGLFGVDYETGYLTFTPNKEEP